MNAHHLRPAIWLATLILVLLAGTGCLGAQSSPVAVASPTRAAVPGNSPESVVEAASPAASPIRSTAVTATPTTQPTATATSRPSAPPPEPTATSTATQTATPTEPALPTEPPNPTATPEQAANAVVDPSLRLGPPPPVRPFPIAKESKLGIGVYSSGGHMMNALQRLEPGVILLQEPSIEFAQEVRRNFPEAFIIGKRFQTGGQPLDNPSTRGAAYADFVAQLAVPLTGVVDAWQSYNEPIGGGDPAQYVAYNAFQVAFAERLQGHYGVSAVAGNDPAGAIQPEEYAEHFAEAIGASDYFGVHAYSSGEAPYRMGEPGAEWYMLRYRKIHEALEAAGLHDVPMVITESGHGDGWRHKIGTEELIQDFVWLTRELEKDDYVVGHAIFGLFDDGGNWGEFNVPTNVLDRLRAYEPGPTAPAATR